MTLGHLIAPYARNILPLSERRFANCVAHSNLSTGRKQTIARLHPQRSDICLSSAEKALLTTTSVVKLSQKHGTGTF